MAKNLFSKKGGLTCNDPAMPDDTTIEEAAGLRQWKGRKAVHNHFSAFGQEVEGRQVISENLGKHNGRMIVAVAVCDPQAPNGEWRAYIGSTPILQDGSDTVVIGDARADIATHGAKLRETEARGIFTFLSKYDYVR